MICPLLVHPLHLGGGGGRGLSIKSTPLLVNGILYLPRPKTSGPRTRAPDTSSGTTNILPIPAPPSATAASECTANWLYFETPDSNLVSLDARTGKQRWKVQIADPKLDYTSTVAPVVVGNHIIVGIGGDHLDNPGFLQSRDPETGPCNGNGGPPPAGRPQLDTWPDEYSAAHGTGQAWIPAHMTLS